MRFFVHVIKNVAIMAFRALPRNRAGASVTACLYLVLGEWQEYFGKIDRRLALLAGFGNIQDG
jgi:hypothetical protein